MLAALLRDLAAHHPVVVGTMPLGIAVDGSDVDIVCDVARVDDLDAFADLVVACCGTRPEFSLTRGDAHVVAGFVDDDTPYEIFAQPTPVYAQHGYRHMVIEARLLRLLPSLRERVVTLKRAGLKTEPAFAAVLGLVGDPYNAVLALEGLDDDTLRRLPLTDNRSAS